MPSDINQILHVPGAEDGSDWTASHQGSCFDWTRYRLRRL